MGQVVGLFVIGQVLWSELIVNFSGGKFFVGDGDDDGEVEIYFGLVMENQIVIWQGRDVFIEVVVIVSIYFIGVDFGDVDVDGIVEFFVVIGDLKYMVIDVEIGWLKWFVVYLEGVSGGVLI